MHSLRTIGNSAVGSRTGVLQMFSIHRTGFAGLWLALAGFFLLSGNVSSAKAGFERFWEAQEPGETLSGHRQHRAAKAVGRRHREAAEDSGDERPRRKHRTARRVASLGGDEDYRPRHRGSVAGGGGVTWTASSGCLNGTLASIIQDVASYGPVTVNSTCRSRSHNAAVGGAHRSQHLTGDAVDFRVHGNISGAIAYLRSNGSIGGYKHYGGGLFHIDTGPRRTW